jgi:transcriptional regulator with XRE-family HTH domain
MEKYTEIGQRIKQLRGALSQRDFAEKLGLSLMGYQNYESGRRIPPGPVLSKIAALSGVTVDWILTGIELLTAVRSDRVAEEQKPYGLDDVTQKVVQMMARMTDEDKREVLKYASFREQDAKKKLKEGQSNG